MFSDALMYSVIVVSQEKGFPW